MLQDHRRRQIVDHRAALRRRPDPSSARAATPALAAGGIPGREPFAPASQHLSGAQALVDGFDRHAQLNAQRLDLLEHRPRGHTGVAGEIEGHADDDRRRAKLVDKRGHTAPVGGTIS